MQQQQQEGTIAGMLYQTTKTSTKKTWTITVSSDVYAQLRFYRTATVTGVA
jgi:hypothetical protein